MRKQIVNFALNFCNQIILIHLIIWKCNVDIVTNVHKNKIIAFSQCHYWNLNYKFLSYDLKNINVINNMFTKTKIFDSNALNVRKFKICVKNRRNFWNDDCDSKNDDDDIHCKCWRYICEIRYWNKKIENNVNICEIEIQYQNVLNQFFFVNFLRRFCVFIDWNKNSKYRIVKIVCEKCKFERINF